MKGSIAGLRPPQRSSELWERDRELRKVKKDLAWYESWAQHEEKAQEERTEEMWREMVAQEDAEIARAEAAAEEAAARHVEEEAAQATKRLQDQLDEVRRARHSDYMETPKPDVKVVVQHW